MVIRAVEIKRTYFDPASIAGKLTDKRFLKLSQQYEAEQEQLESELKRLADEMETMQEQTGRVDKFMALVDRYTSFDELTTPMLNEFVEKVVVHERVSVGRYKRKQRVDVYFNFIGRVELPTEPEDEAPATIELPQERYVAVNTSFAALGEYLSQQTEDKVTLSFSDVERVIGKPLCKSAFKFYSYWYPGGNRPISNVIYNAGFDVDRVDLKNQILYLEPIPKLTMNANEFTPDNNRAGKLKQSHIVDSFLFITYQEFTESIEKRVCRPCLKNQGNCAKSTK